MTTETPPVPHVDPGETEANAEKKDPREPTAKAVRTAAFATLFVPLDPKDLRFFGFKIRCHNVVIPILLEAGTTALIKSIRNPR
jgi:hypothetical protein